MMHNITREPHEDSTLVQREPSRPFARLGLGLCLCALAAACDTDAGDREPSQTQRSTQSVRTDAIVVSQETMDAVIDWQKNKSGSLKDHLNSTGLLGSENAAVINQLGTTIDCIAFVVTPSVSHSRKLHNNNGLEGWREAVSFRTTSEHKIDNKTDSKIVGGVLGKATEIVVSVNTSCAEGVDTSNIRPRLSLHNSYYGKVLPYTFARTYAGGAAHAKLEIQGAVASNIVDFDSAKAFRVNTAKTLTIKASSDAESPDWIERALIDLVEIAKVYARTATGPVLTDPPDPPDDKPPVKPSAPDDEGKTSFGARLLGAIDSATGKELIDKAAEATTRILNGVAHAVDQKRFQPDPYVLEEKIEQGRLTKDAEGTEEHLELEKPYIYKMHVEYDIYGEVSAKHTSIDPGISRQHAHVRAQIVDDFIFAGTIGFEDMNNKRIAGHKEAGFFVAGSQLPQNTATASYPAPEGWVADEEFLESDVAPVTFAQLAPERSFSELGDRLRFFFETVWSSHPDAEILKEAKALATVLGNRTPTAYADADDDQPPQVNVMVKAFSGVLNPCAPTSTE